MQLKQSRKSSGPWIVDEFQTKFTFLRSWVDNIMASFRSNAGHYFFPRISGVSVNQVWRSGLRVNQVWRSGVCVNLVWRSGYTVDLVWRSGVGVNLVWRSGVSVDLVWSPGVQVLG